MPLAKGRDDLPQKLNFADADAVEPDGADGKWAIVRGQGACGGGPAAMLSIDKEMLQKKQITHVQAAQDEIAAQQAADKYKETR